MSAGPRGVRVEPDLIEALRCVPLLEHLAPLELAELAGLARPRTYARGEVVFFQGEPGTAVYIVQTGRVRLILTSRSGKEVQLATFGKGDFFGDLAVFSGLPRAPTAIAREDSRLLLLSQADFLSFLRGHVELAIKLLGVLASRLYRADRLIEQAAFIDVSDRLAFALVRLMEDRGEPAPGGINVGGVTQTDLAAMMGTSRESVNKWIGAYERDGILRWKKGSMTVSKPDELRARLAPEQLQAALRDRRGAARRRPM